MNMDFLRYKSRFITITLILGYAYLHFVLTRTFVETPFDQVLHFSVRFPYAQRILIPLLVYPFSWLPVQSQNLFFMAEMFFTTLMYFGVYVLLRTEFNIRESQLLSWLFILILPLVTIINYRFTVGAHATFFYPADTPAIFFTALGLFWCLRARWIYYIPLVFIATLNRESAILLVLLIPVLNWQRIKEILKPLSLSFLAYLCARIIILYFLKGISGQLIEWNAFKTNYTHFEVNLNWLFSDLNLLLFCFCFAGLPLFWFAFHDYIPRIYRPLRYLIALYFVGLLLVGNFIEARIFGELIVLLYFPVCCAVRNWLAEFNILQENQMSKNFLFYLNRYAILVVFACIIIFQSFLNQALLWCLHHFLA